MAAGGNRYGGEIIAELYRFIFRRISFVDGLSWPLDYLSGPKRL